MSPPAPTVGPGSVFEKRYAVTRLIGRGAMADIFEARDVTTGGWVALKMLRASAPRDLQARARFAGEARVQAMVRHPNVAVLYGAGTSADGHPYLVLELLRGRSLAVILRAEGRLAPARAVGHAVQALHGLAATHAVGVLHRDLKPGNLMIEPAPGGAERVVVIDFGFASLEGGTGLTQHGHVVGSLSYLAPERLRGETPDGRADVYSLGAVLYELLVGRPPFVGDEAAVVTGHLDEHPAPPSLAAPGAGISRALDAAVLRSLAKRPDDRPAGALAMAAELAAAQ